jgi:succinyl-CoA synthetase beta subunit
LIRRWASCRSRAQAGRRARLEGRFDRAGAKLFAGVYKTWWECDASMVESIRCAVVELRGRQGKSSWRVDAKIGLDDNALYRHKDIQAMRDLNEEAPLEIEASKFNLNYIKLDGSIACLVNGAGLAMATMDIIQHFRRQPGQLPGRGRRREQGTGHGRVQDHFERPEREGHSGQHFRRHHGLQRHRHRHRRGGEGNRA